MNTTTKKLILVLILVFPVLLLTSCIGEVNWSFVELAVRSWASENNLVENGTWKPAGVVQKVAEDQIAEITNQDRAVQLTGLDVIRDIEKANNLAWHARDTNNPDVMQEAIDKRPGDWRLQEQNAALWLQNSNSAAANNALTESDGMLQNSMRGENCVALRMQQLEYRENTIQSSLSLCTTPINDYCTKTELDEALFNTQEELLLIYATKQTPFCE